MRRDLRVGRCFFQGRQEVAGQSHRVFTFSGLRIAGGRDFRRCPIGHQRQGPTNAMDRDPAGSISDRVLSLLSGRHVEFKISRETSSLCCNILNLLNRSSTERLPDIRRQQKSLFSRAGVSGQKRTRGQDIFTKRQAGPPFALNNRLLRSPI
jgi:hypothetical protein